jgi:hypothetical protein
MWKLLNNSLEKTTRLQNIGVLKTKGNPQKCFGICHFFLAIILFLLIEPFFFLSILHSTLTLCNKTNEFELRDFSKSKTFQQTIEIHIGEPFLDLFFRILEN